MKAYIKRSSDFKTVLMGTAESWSLPVASADGDTGQLALAEYAPAEHTGNWVYVLGQIYRIAQATPSNNQFTATLADPATAFDRQAIWPDAPETTYGAFIKAALERDYLNCADAAYKVPYLQITNTDTTPLTAPELDDTKLYKLTNIITTARAAGVRIRFGIDGDKLAINISAGTGTEHNILFTDGRAQLETESYSADTTAKVTVLQAQEKAEDADKDAPTEYVAHTFYLSTDGEITETAPTDRAEGKWAYITCKADETPADKAAEVFAANANSYKIEFYSSRRYALYDRVRLRLHGAVFATRITGITLKSGDDRYLYRCGELATTIQQKVKKSMSGTTAGTCGGGSAGRDGVTPTIGANGNWFYGSTDTGLPSRGENGSDATVTKTSIKEALGYDPADPSEFLPLSGGTLTGNLTGKYIAGTWLQSTAAGHQTTPATKVPVFDSQGWIYWRSPAELKSDMHADYVLNVKDYGAQGDGTTDDTAAIQTALNKGGTIYFPPGRYKTTAKLSALVPALLLFANPYPTSGNSDNGTGIETGARIESYSTAGGMLVGDSVQVDGLALRAMTGFAGVLLEHDATQGTKSYPTTARFEDIRLDNGSNSACPTAMFAIKSNGNYGLVLDNISFGNKYKRQYCTYGLKIDVDTTNWANSFHLRDINFDIKASYPLYIENTGGSGNCKNFTFENIVIQAEKFAADETIITGHVNCATLKNIHEISVIGCKVWDVNSSTITGDVVTQSSCTKISVVGSDGYWSALNTLAQYKTAMATAVSASDTQYPTCNAVKKYVAANTPTITDAQVAAGVAAWMDAHSTPTTVTSKNLYNPNDSDVVDGYIQSGGGIGGSTTVWTSGFIPAKGGDVVYLSNNGTAKNMYFIGLYDSSKTFISRVTANAASVTLDSNSNIAYIRVSVKNSAGAKTDPMMICLNNSDLSYEAYGTHTEGGLGQYLVLSSPNGTKYTISVSDAGVLSASPV